MTCPAWVTLDLSVFLICHVVWIVHVIRESLVVCMGVGEGYVQACSVQDMTVERYEREVYISKVPL